jgi:hypothetical protein
VPSTIQLKHMFGKILVATACVSMKLDTPILSIKALPFPVDEESAVKLFQATEEILISGQKIVSLWDLTDCILPSLRIQKLCIKWAMQNKPRLDDTNRALAIVVKRRPVRALVDMVLRLFGPSAPTRVFTDKVDAELFLKENTPSECKRPMMVPF